MTTEPRLACYRRKRLSMKPDVGGHTMNRISAAVVALWTAGTLSAVAQWTAVQSNDPILTELQGHWSLVGSTNFWVADMVCTSNHLILTDYARTSVTTNGYVVMREKNVGFDLFFGFPPGGKHFAPDEPLLLETIRIITNQAGTFIEAEDPTVNVRTTVRFQKQ